MSLIYICPWKVCERNPTFPQHDWILEHYVTNTLMWKLCETNRFANNSIPEEAVVDRQSSSLTALFI